MVVWVPAGAVGLAGTVVLAGIVGPAGAIKEGGGLGPPGAVAAGEVGLSLEVVAAGTVLDEEGMPAEDVGAAGSVVPT